MAETTHPEPWEVHKVAKETDGVDTIDEVSDETLDECWDVHREVWESNVRDHLTNEVDLTEYDHGGADDLRVVAVEYDDV